MEVYLELPRDLQNIVANMLFDLRYNDVLTEFNSITTPEYMCDHCNKRINGIYMCTLFKNGYWHHRYNYCYYCIDYVSKNMPIEIYSYDEDYDRINPSSIRKISNFINKYY